MFKKLFGGGEKSESEEGIVFDGSFHRLGWVSAQGNPYGVVALDCRSYTRSTPANSPGPEVAASFLRLRKSTGHEHSGKDPRGAIELACDLRYPLPAKNDNGPVFRARVMEDRWDAFNWDRCWYLTHSWSGELVFRAPYQQEADSVRVTRILHSSALDSAGDPELALRQADFLIKNLVYQWSGPHPLASGFPREIRRIVEHSFQQYGRRASFATYDDTLALRVEA